jgi:mannose-binding lectin
MAVLFAQFSGQQQQFLNSVAIPGLTLTLPEGAGESALVTLNVPASYAVIANFTSGRGGQFNISVDGTTLPAYAEYDYVVSMNSQNTPVRMPTTLVVAVPLKLRTQTVVGFAANCIIDSPCSLSAIIA